MSTDAYAYALEDAIARYGFTENLTPIKAVSSRALHPPASRRPTVFRSAWLVEVARFEAFATETKLPALKHRDLVGEHEASLLFSLNGLVALRDVSIALGDEAGELGQLLALIGELGHQLLSKVAQL